MRYISNRSSGKMGYALAEAAAARGARVILVSGPVQLPAPHGVTVVHVQTAREMRDAGNRALARGRHHRQSGRRGRLSSVAGAPAQNEEDRHADVAGTRSDARHPGRIGPEEGRPPADRIRRRNRKSGRERRRKLESKNCDMVVANLVDNEATGFESDDNEVVLVLSTGETIPLSRAPKREIADRIFDQVLKLRLAVHAAQ